MALGVLLLAAAPWFLLRRGSHYTRVALARLGWGLPPAPGGRPLWIHAVSVGEVGVAATLAAALPTDLPLLVTTVTPTGQERARDQLQGRATVAYLPFDLALLARRFLRRFQPAGLVLVEGDYWPLTLEAAARHDVPVAVVNGRLGDRSFARLRRWPRIAHWLLGTVRRFGVQSERDRERLEALGVDHHRVVVTGNLKYDSPEPERNPELEAELLRLAAGRPLLVAGSTMPGEEELVIDAFQALGGGRRACLLIAPRHPERWEAVASLLAERGLETVRRSGAPGSPPPEVVLLDSLGELAALYRLAAGVLIGGTLVSTGGHNPLEAALFARPIAAGPSMENFREVAEHFDLAEAWRRVRGPDELAAVWARWIDVPGAAERIGERARKLVLQNRGAVGRTLELIAPLLDRHPARSDSRG